MRTAASWRKLCARLFSFRAVMICASVITGLSAAKDWNDVLGKRRNYLFPTAVRSLRSPDD